MATLFLIVQILILAALIVIAVRLKKLIALVAQSSWAITGGIDRIEDVSRSANTAIHDIRDGTC
ncbi:hypothetical protein [Marinobacter segnicrescens]|uniref:hypothetical protein n=1 Tax=Marinobacter segnicrescens TaxID=430453 RepID=UPI003A8D6903